MEAILKKINGAPSYLLHFDLLIHQLKHADNRSVLVFQLDKIVGRFFVKFGSRSPPC